MNPLGLGGERVFVIRPLVRLIAALLPALLAGTAAGGPPERESRPDEAPLCLDESEFGCAHARAAAARLMDSGGGGFLRAVLAGAASQPVDLLNYDLDIQIAPVAETIAGSNTLTLRILEDGLTQWTFMLDDVFTIGAVRIGGTALSFTRLDPVLVGVTLDRSYDTGDEFDLTIEYSGTPQEGQGFGSFLFQTRAGGAIVAATLSETDYAHTWFPVTPDGRDKATGDLRFTVPTTMSVASNGLLQGVTLLPGGTEHTWHWRTDYPTATYLFSFGATNYVHFSDVYVHAGGAMPLEFFIYPEINTAGNRASWLKTKDMLANFAPLFGEYPFIGEKYGIYNFPFGGGMEHQTMTGQGTNAFGESITAHELAHQWWGDMVTCETWPDIWLNEGFATYAEALWHEHKPGSSGATALHSAMLARRPSTVDGTIIVPEGATIGRIFSFNFSYLKPAWVLHMLRHILGDAAFFQTLAAYRAAHEHGSATSDDFQAAAESVSGLDLSWFFEEWLEMPGAPDYRRASRNISVNGQAYVELMIQQVQSLSYPLFKMPLDVVATIGGSPQTFVVWNDVTPQHYLIPVSATPSAVALDPTPWVLAWSTSTVSFVEGPPKVVSVSPAPGASLPVAPPNLSVVFHKNVSAAAGDFVLVRSGGSAPALSLSYSAGTFTATLTPLSTLPPGDYAFTVNDSVIGVAGSQALDGETTDPSNPFLAPGAMLLPTGDGAPGGDAVFSFTVLAPPPQCQGDADGDDDADFNDILIVLANFGASYSPAADGLGDADHDGDADFDDVLAVLGHFGVVCP